MLQEHLLHVQNWVEERVGTMALPWDPELLEILPWKAFTSMEENPPTKSWTTYFVSITYFEKTLRQPTYICLGC